jgi:hypothetical protein
VNASQRIFNTSVRDLADNRGGDVEALKTEIADAIDELQDIPSLSVEADDLAARLLRVMEDQYELVQDIQRAGTVTFAHGRRLDENVDEYDEIMSSFNEWVDTEGRKYGIGMGKRP